MAEFENNPIVVGENISYPAGQTIEYEKAQFEPLQNEKNQSLFRQDIFGNIPVEITVEMGRTKISLKEVMDLSKGSVLELNKAAGEALDLYVNGQLIGRGEVVAIDNAYGIRVTEVIQTVQTVS